MTIHSEAHTHVGVQKPLNEGITLHFILLAIQYQSAHHLILYCGGLLWCGYRYTVHEPVSLTYRDGNPMLCNKLDTILSIHCVYKISIARVSELQNIPNASALCHPQIIPRVH